MQCLVFEVWYRMIYLDMLCNICHALVVIDGVCRALTPISHNFETSCEMAPSRVGRAVHTIACTPPVRRHGVHRWLEAGSQARLREVHAPRRPALRRAHPYALSCFIEHVLGFDLIRVHTSIHLQVCVNSNSGGTFLKSCRNEGYSSHASSYPCYFGIPIPLQVAFGIVNDGHHFLYHFDRMLSSSWYRSALHEERSTRASGTKMRSRARAWRPYRISHAVLYSVEPCCHLGVVSFFISSKFIAHHVNTYVVFYV